MEPLTHRIALLPLGGSMPAALAAALAWLSDVAHAHFHFSTTLLEAPAVAPGDRVALCSTPGDARVAIARLAPQTPDALVVAGPGQARPHCWHTPDGRRYALIPESASLAVIAHELGHLLFRWPDLRLPAGSGAACLMAPLGSTQPVRPCAPMRVSAGWETPQPLQAGTAPATLPEGRSFLWADMLIERQGTVLAGFVPSGRSVALAFLRPILASDRCALALASRSMSNSLAARY